MSDTFMPDALDHPVFSELAKTARKTGTRAYVIGGYVRDYLLKRSSGEKDIDIVVEGKGVDFAEEFGRQVKSKKIAVYKNFGTALVQFGNINVEFVGARKESYRRNSRKPIVEAGTLEDDQGRRDFTINALSISLNDDDFGRLNDPFGGIQDLQAKIIRTPLDPQVTFSDDPLRMMRAIRFSAQLQFEIESDTLEAIHQNCERLNIVSAERIIEEFNKMVMVEKKPSRGIKLTQDTGLLPQFFPELSAMGGVEVIDSQGHKDNFLHTLKVLDNVAEFSNDLWLRWVAILHDIAKPLTKRFSPETGWTFHGHEDKGARMVPKIFRRLKLPMNEHMRYVRNLVRLHQRPIALVNEEVSDSAIRRLVVEAGENLDDLLNFCRADITSRNPKKVARFLANYDALEKRIREVEERDNLRNWQPPVSGEVIMNAFGLKPSKTVGDIKNDIREAILDGVIPNEEQAALDYMHQIAPKYIAKKP